MVDLNLWRLTYPGVDLEFGTHETGYPLTRQVEIGPAAMAASDTDQPMTDGVLFGVDRFRGRTIRFTGAHIDKTPLPDVEPWNKPLDLALPIARAWKGDGIRQRAGAVATLEHVDRGRVVFGRPRDRTPDLTLVRRGWSEWTGDFVTVDDMFYGALEQQISAHINPGPFGGITAPVVAPVVTSSAGESRAWLDVHSTAPTWATLVFDGPCTNPAAELLDAGGATLWKVSIAGGIAAGKTIVVDARPWSRGVFLNGVTPAPGVLRGDQLANVRVPADSSVELRFTATSDPTGAAGCTIKWRDAFDEL